MFTLPTDKPMQNYRNYPKGNRHILSLDGDDNVFGNYCAVKDKIKLCVCAVKQGNFVEGLRIAEETIKLADRHTSAIILQALCLYELRRPQQALDAINQYLVKEKDIHQVWSLKATFLEELGDLEGKKFCQKQMDRTDPDFYFWDFS
jgi:tetratricopeptide (TPR) repeat protein